MEKFKVRVTPAAGKWFVHLFDIEAQKSLCFVAQDETMAKAISTNLLAAIQIVNSVNPED